MKKEFLQLNKSVWAADIKKAIADWEDFAECIFCDDKQKALANANKLKDFLNSVINGTVTAEQYNACVYFLM